MKHCARMSTQSAERDNKMLINPRSNQYTMEKKFGIKCDDPVGGHTLL